ncbi:hypothetical protein SPRG_01383 [Saprolegnia parasitica CBS 223.65]|uniref:Uncharacterized protein n=1 Tax=Saprolegnia parasitica (strain CBS 223.65) TaxID=695850 RepID=A0A067D537_SAPPC|nr:hypothetical protein SPRG_01383 [Saprolegnia parasitica CBS 223.65]KDO34112.1 hypothetical protein SPRG_01383 [Saprolegnia parasitica CBS 223.65]|eukprot:XP_012194991.1 hypothetical protein SPRG_01383 [Saprolegnia parasitica CBS 223.65]
MTPIAMRRRSPNAATAPLKESLPTKYDSFFTKTTSSVSDTAPASPALYPPLKPRGMSVPQVTLTTTGPKPRTLTVDLERPPLPLPNVAVDFNFQSIFHRIQECVHKIQDIKKDLEDETTRHRY